VTERDRADNGPRADSQQPVAVVRKVRLEATSACGRDVKFDPVSPFARVLAEVAGG
jgi:hypothetical protein